MPHATPSFAVPQATVGALAGTRPALRELRLLGAGLHSRRLVLLKSLLVRAERHGVPPSVRRNLNEHWQLLARAEARDPVAAREALDYPSVGNWLLHGLGIPLSRPSAFAEFLGGLGALAASVALQTGTGFRLTLPARSGRLVLPGLGVYRSGASRVRVVAGPRSLRLTPGRRGTGTVLAPPYERAAGAGWHGLLPLHGGATLLDALDPHRAGIRPREPGTPSLTPRTARRWAARWRGALVLLEAADPERRVEVARLVRALVPLPRPAGRTKGASASGTLRSAPLAVMTELPCSAQELAAVLVHEVQHSKLALLSDLTPLHHADGTPAHRVPWRTDLRPFDAVLQGAYAHLALADLWHRFAARPGATTAARAAARATCEGYRAQVAEALAVLGASGELTDTGARFTDGMARRLGALHRHPSSASRT
ncbi:hypothetical protein HCC61_04585 [Streptomyces sp. HNM0575]|uniref:aKG-HExxH-type peptide beta-hydroxylase n=1 Tax=Streptomyces sp. HNM0575 TaxID=2716338 RepID=UPI00145F5593|nr:HEXXH motif-containing putative peptide modification protein [Streptomyces sp. HNM0575]NLU71967.1 hypothetical protein [Streptomyces sp. HNM0575]